MCCMDVLEAVWPLTIDLEGVEGCTGRERAGRIGQVGQISASDLRRVCGAPAALTSVLEGVLRVYGREERESPSAPDRNLQRRRRRQQQQQPAASQRDKAREDTAALSQMYQRDEQMFNIRSNGMGRSIASLPLRLRRRSFLVLLPGSSNPSILQDGLEPHFHLQ